MRVPRNKRVEYRWNIDRRHWQRRAPDEAWGNDHRPMGYDKGITKLRLASEIGLIVILSYENTWAELEILNGNRAEL